MLTDQDSREPLKWLSQILWPDGSTTIKPGGSASPQWWASPSADNPKILIPAQSIAAARTAVKRYHDGFSTKLRVRSLMAEAIMGIEPLARLVLGRSMVGVEGGLRQAPTVDSDVLEGIRQLLAIDRLHVAASLSTPKSNQKPVLQLLDSDGNCLGWAKVAWNDRTEALVETEADWLRRPAAAPLSKPELLHDVVIAGRRVVIATGVEPRRRARRSSDSPPAPALFEAVSALGTVETLDIGQSAWWASVEAVLDEATDRERAAITAAVDSCAGLEIRLGAWHGDLTPWNLMTTSNRVHLIDWEFAADGVPFGFDLCHFHTQVASEMKGCDDPKTNAARAIDYSARLSPHGMADLGISPENRPAVWRLYLVELMRRYLALRANGYPTDQVTQGPAALERLEKTIRAAADGAADPASGQSSTATEQSDPVTEQSDPVTEQAEPATNRGGFFESADSDSEDDADAGQPIADFDDVPASFADLLGDNPRHHRNGATAR